MAIRPLRNIGRNCDCGPETRLVHGDGACYLSTKHSVEDDAVCPPVHGFVVLQAQKELAVHRTAQLCYGSVWSYFTGQ